jgi:uncharacterized repeat protein (TIGR03803 family)
MRKLGYYYFAGAMGLAMAILPITAGGQTLDVLGSFAFRAHGDTPMAGVVRDSKGDLFGTTTNANSQRNRPKAKYYGTVFEVRKEHGQPKLETIWRFGQTHADGQYPYAPVVIDKSGNLYGETAAGGSRIGNGAVFELSPPASPKGRWVESVLYSFAINGADGENPVGGLLLQSDGSLFGVTQTGGSQGVGTVFKLEPPKAGKKHWVLTSLYSFLGGTDGAQPVNGLIRDKSGALYGTTLYGGTASLCLDQLQYDGCGTVFKLTPPAKGSTTWTESVIWTFQGAADGAFPMTNLVMDPSGNIYATASEGGPGDCLNNGFACGTVVELSPPANGGTNWTETVLVGFGDSAGEPQGNLVRQTDGSLFVPVLGGAGILGAITELVPPTGGQGWTESIYYAFPANGQQGARPFGLMQDAAGNFFGTTELDGPNGGGVVFELTP